MAKLPIRVPRGQLGPLLINSLLNITGWHILSAYGLQHMDAGRASIIAFTMPLWAALMAVPVLGERMSAVTLAGLAVGMAGIAALIVPEWRAIVSAPLGLTFMLLSALSWALGTVLLKRWRWDMPTSVLAGWQLLLGGLPVAVGALIFDRDFEPQAVSWVAWSAVAFAALIPSIYCQWAWCRIVAIHPAAVAGISTLAIPVVGVLSSSLALKEPIGIDIMLSLVLVLAGLCLVLIVPALRPRPRRAG
jgi:drug/metabolite transporter (DMT)-like permease